MLVRKVSVLCCLMVQIAMASPVTHALFAPTVPQHLEVAVSQPEAPSSLTPLQQQGMVYAIAMAALSYQDPMVSTRPEMLAHCMSSRVWQTFMNATRSHHRQHMLQQFDTVRAIPAGQIQLRYCADDPSAWCVTLPMQQHYYRHAQRAFSRPVIFQARYRLKHHQLSVMRLMSHDKVHA